MFAMYIKWAPQQPGVLKPLPIGIPFFLQTLFLYNKSIFLNSSSACLIQSFSETEHMLHSTIS